MLIKKDYSRGFNVEEISIKQHIIEEFKSINEFYEVANNETDEFKMGVSNYWRTESDSNPTCSANDTFYMTPSYQKALDLLKNGWHQVSERLNNDLKKLNVEHNKVQKLSLGVQGFTPCVPNYLNGSPMAMFKTKVVYKKNKIITFYKHIAFLGDVSAEYIYNQNIKFLHLIDTLEKQGFKCNIIACSDAISRDTKQLLSFRIKIKSSTEKLNVSKLAFVLCNPSMQRRMIFRWREKSNLLVNRGGSYGTVYYYNDLKTVQAKMGKDNNNEYVIPSRDDPQRIMEFQDKQRNKNK